jgi:hypothetical protein
MSGSDLHASGTQPQATRFTLNKAGTCLPVWDKQLTVMPPASFKGKLTGIATDKLLPMLAKRFPAPTNPKQRLPRAPIMKWDQVKIWESPSMTPVSFVLAKDCLVAVTKERKGYAAAAYKREDGTKGWNVDLPERPAMNRIAIDKDGRILIALCDGSVMCLGK